MRIEIIKWGEAYPELYYDLETVCWHYVPNTGARCIYDIKDKSLFFLAVLRYGIEYKLIDDEN